MSFIYNGMTLEAVRETELAAIHSAFLTLESYFNDPTFETSETCMALLEETDLETEGLISSNAILGTTIIGYPSIAIADASLPVSLIPRPEDAAEAGWTSGRLAELSSNYGGGAWFPAEELPVLRRVVRNLAAYERGDCEPRTVSSLALVGALGLAGAAAVALAGIFAGGGKKR